VNDVLHISAARAFLDAYAECHPDDTIRTLDLERARIPEFGSLESAAKYRILHGDTVGRGAAMTWEAVEGAIRDFKRADKLVISSPMWNFGIPCRLKQYVDIIVQPGYTFSFSPEEGYRGLVPGRPALLFLARGGDYAPGSEAASFDFQRSYLEAILRVIGFSDISAIVIEPTEHGGRELADQKLAEAIDTACEMARSF